MKKAIAMLLLITMLALTACGQPAAAQTKKDETQTQNAATAQIANPWRSVTEEEAKSLCPGSLTAPAGAQNVHFRAMETAGQPALVQLDFDYDGYAYTAREQQTNDKSADISGMYYTWTHQTDMTLRNWPDSAKAGTCYRFIGEGEWADLCAWYDTATGVSYTLSVTAKDLDGFDLQAIAEMLYAAQAAPAAASGRQDGERFDAVILLEGMEETVHYEHLRNAALGFEMDYDYESFTRLSGVDRERFVSVWDNAGAPENYLDVLSFASDAETVASWYRAALADTYDLLEHTRELENAGSCLYIEASVLKGTNRMGDQIQTVTIVPTADGCRVAAAHYVTEAAEGFGRRFSNMLNTLTVMERSGAIRLSDEQALTAVTNYCKAANGELQSAIDAGQNVYWKVTESTDARIVVTFRSYTGAFNYFYVDRVSGEAAVTERVPGIIDDEQFTPERFNAWAYLG